MIVRPFIQLNGGKLKSVYNKDSVVGVATFVFPLSIQKRHISKLKHIGNELATQSLTKY